MFAATIVPQSYLNLVANQQYHLALAHLIGKAGFEQYTSFYAEVGNHQDKFLILDNGLIEGDPRPIDEIIYKARKLNAQEIVLPDVFQDRERTRNAVADAMDFICDNGVTEFRMQVVPQGSTYDEWLACAKEFIDWGIDTIAIPKVVTKMAGRDGRLRALIDLQEHIKTAGCDVHLLGCWDSPLELKVIESAVQRKQIQPVRGVDSAIAYVYSRAGLRMSEAERPEGKIDFGADDVADLELLQYNIDMWQHECATLDSKSNVVRFW